jgi:hypothetical protein
MLTIPHHPAAELRPNPLDLKITEWPTPLVFFERQLLR